MTRTRPEVHEAHPNIFVDLGLPDADAHFLKAQIVAELYRLSTDRKLTQAVRRQPSPTPIGVQN